MVSRYVSNFALGLGPGNPSAHPPPHVPQMPLGVAMAATAAAAAAAAVVPQQQQQQQQQTQTLKGPNPSEYHVSPCLVQGPSAPAQAQHQHYRILHSRSDGYVAAPSAGFSQGGPPHQAPTVLRGMQSTAPSTPPQQQDLNKMNQPPSQTMYVPSAGANGTTNIRQTQQNMFRGGSSGSGQRAPRHSIPLQPGPFISQQMPPMMVQPPSYHAQYTTQRQPTSQMFPPSQQYQLQQASFPANYTSYSPYISYPIQQQQRSVGVPSGIVQAGAPGLGGPNTAQQHIPMQSNNMLTTIPTAATATGSNTLNNKKRRKYAMKIIDPITNRNILDEIEMAKSHQSGTSIAPDVGYAESLGHTVEVIGGPMHGIAEASSTVSEPVMSGVNLATSNANNAQGTFIDLMNQHKISAVVPPATQPPSSVLVVNESLNQTPVVSAMSDGPSVEIPPKQQSSKSKRTKSNDAMQQQQPDKMSDTKDLSLVSQQITGAKTAEETSDNSSKNTSRQSASPLPSQLDPISKENHIVELTNQTKNAYDDNHHQNISAISTQRLKQLEQSQSVSNSGENDSIASDAAITSTQPDDSFNKGTGLTVSQPSDGLLSSDLGSATQFLPSYKENNKKNTSNIQSITTSASNNNISKNSREKDKNQQASSSNNNPSVIRSASDTNTEQIASPNYGSNTSSSIQTNNRLVSVLNNSNQMKGEKMKINDKTDISSTVVSNKVVPNTNVPEKNNNKKISDKNDNIIPNKSSHQNQKHQRQSQQRTVTAKESQQQSDSVSSNYNSNFSSSTKTSSLCPSNQPSTWNKPDVDTSKSTQNTIINLVTPIPLTSKASQIDVSVDEIDRAGLPTINAANKTCFVNETSSTDLNDSDEFQTDSSRKHFESKAANNIDVTIISPDVKSDALSDKNSNLIEEPLNELQTKEENEPCKINSHDLDCKKLDIGKSFNQEHSNEKCDSNSQLPDQSNETVKSKDEQENSSLIPAQISNGSNKVESSPISSNVPKSYGREQLLELRYAPLSQSKPKVNNAALFKLELGKPSEQSLMPSFARGPSGKRHLSNSGISLSSGNSTGGHQFLKQSSMSGVNAKSNAKGSKSGLIHVSLSLREDVKLNETENAWRPTRLKRDDNLPEAERSKDELLRKVRGILNKLTPEKFNTLVDQLMKLQIDTQEKINGVMILVFEKAIDEPNFSVSYARLCLHLAENKLASEVKKDGQKVGSDGKGSNMVLFKCALLDKTQREFTDNVLERKAKEQKLKPLIEKLKDCTDPEKRLEIKEILEEEDRKIRRRSGGTVRFIGELFKINMLTAKIIRDCIKNLLEPSSEDKLECLCKLLTTVGDRLEQLPTPKEAKNWSLDNVFKKMQGIVDRKTEWSKQISSRVRFMLQDVIDLRKNKWQSKRNDMNPKTMEQIQKEAENEQYNNQLIHSTALSNKKDERRYTGIGAGNSNNVSSNNSGVSGNSNTGSGGYYNKGNRQQSSNDAEVWYTKTSKGARAIDATKLGQICTDYESKMNEERRLGDSAQFQWNRVKDSQKPTTTTSNSFAPLSNLDLGRGSNNGPRNRGSYTKSSMERDRYEGRNSRGGSINGSRENSVSRSSVRNSNASRSTGTSHTYSVPNAHPSSSRSGKVGVPAAVVTATVEPTFYEKAVLNKFNDDPTKRLEEVINEMVTTAIEVSFSEAIVVGETIPECYRSDFIKIILSSYLHLSKTKEQHREKAAEIVLELYYKKFLTLDHILKGYEQFSMDASDISIDVPDLWKYVFQFIGPLLSEGVISLKHLWNENLVDAKMGKVFFKHLFMYCNQEIGPYFTQEMWRTSELTWQTCFNKDDHVQFIKHNNFEFIDANDAPRPVYGEPNMPRILAKIEKMLKGEKGQDLIIDYINGNIKASDKTFIRGLTTIVLENALIRSERGTKLDTKKFNKSYGVPLLQRYIDSKEEFELECLYAIQVLIHRLEYPQGLLFEIFWALFEHDAICQDAFIKWRDSPEERAAGKGVAVKGLNKFFELIVADSTDENN